MGYSFSVNGALYRFEFFIILGAQRFRSVHSNLVHETKAMNKTFYFVRSNTDLDLEASKRQRPSDYSEEKILLKIKDNCNKGLKREGVSNPKVFLVSNYETCHFDFALFQEKLKNDLLRLKKQAFLFSLPSIYLPVLDKKKTAMKKQLLTRAFWSTYFMLMKFVSNGANDTQSVLIEALMREEKKSI